MTGAIPDVDPDLCPHCGVALRYQVDGVTHSRREMHEIQGVCDGVLFYQCAACGGRWHRWREESRPRLFRAAEPYVRGER